MRVALKRLDGTESIDVILSRGLAQLKLRPGNRITLDQLRKIVRDNGFTPKEAEVVAVGGLVNRSGAPALTVAGIDVVYGLVEDPKASQAWATLQKSPPASADRVEVTGTIRSDAANRDRIEVRDVRIVRANP